MQKGVPYRVQVMGNRTRTYTFTEIAEGTGLSLALVSLIMRGKRPVSEYAQPRLAQFFGISIEQLGTPGPIQVHTPPVPPVGRIVGRIPHGSPYSSLVRDRNTALRLLETLEPEPCPPCPRV